MAYEGVNHAWRDRLPRSSCGSKQGCVRDHGRRKEYPTLGGGVIAPSQADLPLRDMRGERLETEVTGGLDCSTEGVLLVISRSTAHIAKNEAIRRGPSTDLML
jgi:hypothetical protein